MDLLAADGRAREVVDGELIRFEATQRAPPARGATEKKRKQELSARWRLAPQRSRHRLDPRRRLTACLRAARHAKKRYADHRQPVRDHRVLPVRRTSWSMLSAPLRRRGGHDRGAAPRDRPRAARGPAKAAMTSSLRSWETGRSTRSPTGSPARPAGVRPAGRLDDRGRASHSGSPTTSSTRPSISWASPTTSTRGGSTSEWPTGAGSRPPAAQAWTRPRRGPSTWDIEAEVVRWALVLHLGRTVSGFYGSYLRATRFVRRYARWRGHHPEGGRHRDRTELCTNFSSDFGSQPLHICENAALDNGTLSVAMLRRAAQRDVPTIATRVLMKASTHRPPADRPLRRRHRVPRGVGLQDSDGRIRPFPVQVDGDYIGDNGELELGIEPGALAIDRLTRPRAAMTPAEGRQVCAIVAGDEQAHVVFEDEISIAFLDRRPFPRPPPPGPARALRDDLGPAR